MEISGLDAFRATPDRSKSLDFAASGAAFKQTLQVAQESNGQLAENASASAQNLSPPSGEEQGLVGRRFSHNGQNVSFEELPADVQAWFRAADERSTREEAYRAQVAEDPNVGPTAKLRPFDPELDGWAMKRLAAMDPSTATMTPEQYYNYMGSDREKYDTLIAKAEGPVHGAGARVFGADLEEESKVAMIRDLRAQAQPLPATYGAFEQAWLSDLVRQQALTQERQDLLGENQQRES